jgi:hypothetical protein
VCVCVCVCMSAANQMQVARFAIITTFFYNYLGQDCSGQDEVNTTIALVHF